MNEEEIQVLSAELFDLQIALIFLREGKRRTEYLQKDITKQGYPDLDNRIARIESAIDRFQARADMIRLILAADEAAKENERKAKEKADKKSKE